MKKVAAILTALLCSQLSAVTTVIVAPVQVRGPLASETELLTELILAELSMDPTINLVDRAQLGKVLDEMALGQGGLTQPDQALQIGRLAGAHYFINPRLIPGSDQLMVAVRVTDIETTRIQTQYEMVNPDFPLPEVASLLKDLATKGIASLKTEAKNDDVKVAEVSHPTIPADWVRPRVAVYLPEFHVSRPLEDPAAETEFIQQLLEEGFSVVDVGFNTGSARAQGAISLADAIWVAKEQQVDVLFYGEALSERGAVLRDFSACRARVELRAIDTGSGEIIAIQSAYGSATDLAESMAAKKALQKAALSVAGKILYSVAAHSNPGS